MLSSPGDIYVKTLTFTLYCGGVCVCVCVCVCGGGGGGGWWRNQGVPRLVLNGCGIAVPEIFGAIREDSR